MSNWALSSSDAQLHNKVEDDRFLDHLALAILMLLNEACWFQNEVPRGETNDSED